MVFLSLNLIDAAAAAVEAHHDKTITFRESQIRSCTSCGLHSDEVTAQETEEEDENASQIKLTPFYRSTRAYLESLSSKKSEIQNLVELLESQNPTPQPTLCLEKVAGAWKLIYNTISILGSKRTKLGMRDFINLGDFLQI
ncbi:hypothetical protein OROMI_010439 [Orobanche minor]